MDFGIGVLLHLQQPARSVLSVKEENNQINYSLIERTNNNERISITKKISTYKRNHVFYFKQKTFYTQYGSPEYFEKPGFESKKRSREENII